MNTMNQTQKTLLMSGNKNHLRAGAKNNFTSNKSIEKYIKEKIDYHEKNYLSTQQPWEIEEIQTNLNKNANLGRNKFINSERKRKLLSYRKRIQEKYFI
jgi:hypothetical protein